MKYKITKATVEDMPRWVDLSIAVMRDNRLPFRNGGAKSVADCSAMFLRNPDGVLFIASKEDGEVIAWCGATLGYPTFSDEQIVQVMAWNVHPKLRAQGIGGELLMHVREWALERDIKLMTVGFNFDSSTRPELAMNKLQNMGFKEFSRAYYIKIQ